MLITDDFVFFYKSFYSQWKIAPVRIDGRTYNCSEQYMMHRKATLFEDWETADKIMKAEHPRDHQSLGRTVKNFNQEVWNANAREIVYQANLAKYMQHEDMRKEMLATGNRKFVEASPTDIIWGVGLGEKDPLIVDPKNWRGTNWLGQALDRVKATLLQTKN
jgi:hypothetical protein